MFFKKLMGSLLLGIGLGIFLIEVGIYYKPHLGELWLAFPFAGYSLIVMSIVLAAMAIIEDVSKLFEAKWKNFK